MERMHEYYFVIDGEQASGNAGNEYASQQYEDETK